MVNIVIFFHSCKRSLYPSQLQCQLQCFPASVGRIMHLCSIIISCFLLPYFYSSSSIFMKFSNWIYHVLIKVLLQTLLLSNISGFSHYLEIWILILLCAFEDKYDQVTFFNLNIIFRNIYLRRSIQFLTLLFLKGGIIIIFVDFEVVQK